MSEYGFTKIERERRDALRIEGLEPGHYHVEYRYGLNGEQLSVTPLTRWDRLKKRVLQPVKRVRYRLYTWKHVR